MKKIICAFSIILLVIIIFILYHYNIIPNSFTTKYDYLNTYKSRVDKDLDGIDDQTDILESAKKYLDKNPKYKSKYYASRLF